MNVEILKEEKDELKLRFDKKDFGLLNMIKDKLNEQKEVLIASFKVEHPDVGQPEFLLKTKGKDAKKVWNAAVDDISEEIEKLAKELKKK